jgi:hypothetical protein
VDALFHESAESDMSCRRYDFVVTGSDQLWNPKVSTGTKTHFPVYLLAGIKANKKYAIATSMGGYDASFDIQEFKKNLADFDEIYVRERSSIGHLAGIGISSKSMLDPTLLIQKKEWLNYLTERAYESPYNLPHKYMLVYGLAKDSLFKKGIARLKELYQMPIVSLDTDVFPRYSIDVKISDADGFDFLDLVNNATVIATNSFHGAAFSVNFNKNFYAFRPPSSPNRVVDLLSQMGAKSKLINDISEINTVGLDWDPINKRLEAHRTEDLSEYQKLFH